MLHAASRCILGGVGLVGSYPLRPHSWTPPHTLGGASGAAFFSLDTGNYECFLQPNFIKYEPTPTIVGSEAKSLRGTASEIRQCVQTTANRAVQAAFFLASSRSRWQAWSAQLA
jgi:hypothetical protein